MFHHTSMSIEGAIRNAVDLKGCIAVDGRTLNTVKEIREFMRGQLALGRRVLPMCGCSNFDYQTGCRGHEKPEAWLTLISFESDGFIEVEYNHKTVATLNALDVENLVATWRRSFNLPDRNLFFDISQDMHNKLTAFFGTLSKFEEYDVYFRGEEE